jgi:hypothetical protein
MILRLAYNTKFIEKKNHMFNTSPNPNPKNLHIVTQENQMWLRRNNSLFILEINLKKKTNQEK